MEVGSVMPLCRLPSLDARTLALEPGLCKCKKGPSWSPSRWRALHGPCRPYSQIHIQVSLLEPATAEQHPCIAAPPRAGSNICPLQALGELVNHRSCCYKL
eukprot:47819-Pelagomonas_calceolata.AAC.1